MSPRTAAESGEAVAAHDQYVPDPAVGQVGVHSGPEIRALGLLQPDPQHMLDAVHVDRDGDVGAAQRAGAALLTT